MKNLYLALLLALCLSALAVRAQEDTDDHTDDVSENFAFQVQSLWAKYHAFIMVPFSHAQLPIGTHGLKKIKCRKIEIPEKLIKARNVEGGAVSKIAPMWVRWLKSFDARVSTAHFLNLILLVSTWYPPHGSSGQFLRLCRTESCASLENFLVTPIFAAVTKQK